MRRIRKGNLLDLGRLETEADGHGEEVYDLVGIRPEQMSAENARASFLDQHLISSIVCHRNYRNGRNAEKYRILKEKRETRTTSTVCVFRLFRLSRR